MTEHAPNDAQAIACPTCKAPAGELCEGGEFYCPERLEAAQKGTPWQR